MGLPPKLLPFNLRFKTFSFFLSLRHSLSKLFNSHKILKTKDDEFGEYLLVKNPDKVLNWISLFKSLFITRIHPYLLENARSSLVTTNSSPVDKAFKAFWNSGFISASRLKSSENIKLQPSSFKNCICSSR